MRTFNKFEELVKDGFFIAWYDALAKRGIKKTAHWLLYFDGRDFDLCPVSEDPKKFDKQHLYCFNFNFVKDFPLTPSEQVERMRPLLSYDEMREVLIARDAFTLLDNFVDEDLRVELLKHVTPNYFAKYKILFNQVIDELYDKFIHSSEYQTFIYQIKDMFYPELVKKTGIKDEELQLSIFDQMNFLQRG